MTKFTPTFILLAAMIIVFPTSSAAQDWATTCIFVVDGPRNDGNEDPLRAEGPPDCYPACDWSCRVQLGDGGVLECENLEVPGGWIVPVSGDNNDFTVFEMMVDETYRVLVEDPSIPGTWVLAGEGGPDLPRHFDLPAEIPYTNRVRIEDKGESTLPCPDRGADIDAIVSGEVPIDDCSAAPWHPNFPCSTLGGVSRLASDSTNNVAILVLPLFAALILRRWVRRKP